MKSSKSLPPFPLSAACLAILLLLFSPALAAQQAIGQWQSHQSYTVPTYATAAGNKIYVVASNSLFSFDTEDNSLEEYNKVNALNDYSISQIRYIPETKCLIIVYRNSNIDLMYEDGTVYNLREYADKSLSYNKTINNVSTVGPVFYLCTGFGLVSIDSRTAQFENTYILGQDTYACVEQNGNLYAATADGVYRGDKSTNLLESGNWEKIDNQAFYNAYLFDNTIFFFHSVNGVYRYRPETGSTDRILAGNYHTSTMGNGQMIATNQYSMAIFTSADEWITFDQRTAFNSICYADGLYWGAMADGSLSAYTLDEAGPGFSPARTISAPSGPKRALAAYMKIYGDRLFVCGGGSYLDRYYNNGTIMCYTDGRWTSFQEEGIKDITGLDYLDISTLVLNPADTSQAFASSVGEGVYEFRHGQFVRLYDQANSTLRSCLNGSKRFVRVSGMNYDPDGNLWAFNMEVDSVVNILKPDGSWVRPYYPEISAWNPNRTLFDSKGRLWFGSMKATGGICCITPGDVPESSEDDRVLARTVYYNQDGSSIGSGSTLHVFSMAEDKDGCIWIGSSEGPLLIDSPDRWYEDNFHFTQVKIPRNDGTNLADYLLAGERINAIAVDGGNRKWFGTQENGLYLIDSDNTTQLLHFTTENSPLPSNNIQSIAIFPTTGEVFIGTDAGIVSYQSDATEGGEQFASDVHAFPNPVGSDYTGPITIKGLMRESDIKIVDAGGRLVRQGVSTGGMYTWDGCNAEGRRVARGVYMVLAADAEGKESVVTKIAVIR